MGNSYWSCVASFAGFGVLCCFHLNYNEKNSSVQLLKALCQDICSVNHNAVYIHIEVTHYKNKENERCQYCLSSTLLMTPTTNCKKLFSCLK